MQCGRLVDSNGNQIDSEITCGVRLRRMSTNPEVTPRLDEPQKKYQRRSFAAVLQCNLLTIWQPFDYYYTLLLIIFPITRDPLRAVHCNCRGFPSLKAISNIKLGTTSFFAFRFWIWILGLILDSNTHLKLLPSCRLGHPNNSGGNLGRPQPSWRDPRQARSSLVGSATFRRLSEFAQRDSGGMGLLGPMFGMTDSSGVSMQQLLRDTVNSINAWTTKAINDALDVSSQVQ